MSLRDFLGLPVVPAGRRDIPAASGPSSEAPATPTSPIRSELDLNGETCKTCGQTLIGHRLMATDPAMLHPWTWSHAGCGLFHASRASRAACRLAAEKADGDHAATPETRLADDLSKLPLRADLKPRAFRIGTADAVNRPGRYSA